MRPSLPGLPSRSGGSNVDPALGIAVGNANDAVTGVTYGTMTLGTLVAGDGFTLSSNALVCSVPGVYALILSIGAAITAGSLGEIAYAVNGGTEVVAAVVSNTGYQQITTTRFVKLGAGDSLKIRIRGNGGGDTITLGGLTGNANSVALMQVSTFQ